MVHPKPKFYKGIAWLSEESHGSEEDVKNWEDNNAEHIEECGLKTCRDFVVLKELLVLQQVRSPKVSWDKKAEEGKTTEDDVVILEVMYNVDSVRGKGSNAEEEE